MDLFPKSFGRKTGNCDKPACGLGKHVEFRKVCYNLGARYQLQVSQVTYTHACVFLDYFDWITCLGVNSWMEDSGRPPKC